MSIEPERREDDSPSIGALLRLGAGAYVRTAFWAVGSSATAARRVGEAVRSGQAPAELLDTVRDEVVNAMRRLLGDEVVEERLGQVIPEEDDLEDPRETDRQSSLRKRGEELLRRSADVRDEVDVHPAFLAMIDELTPDEARILRLLAHQGRQAMIDFHVVELSGEIEKAGRVSFVAAEAGLAHPEELPYYLDNLQRLGLTRVTRMMVDDDQRYEVLLAQPEAQALRRRGLAGLQVRPGRRSLELTDLGHAFCAAALPVAHGPERPPQEEIRDPVGPVEDGRRRDQ